MLGKLLGLTDLREREPLRNGDDERSLGDGANQGGEALGIRVRPLVTDLEPALVCALRVAGHGRDDAAPPHSVEEPLRDGRPDGVGDSIQDRQPSTVDLVVQGDDAVDAESLGRVFLAPPDASPDPDAAPLTRMVSEGRGARPSSRSSDPVRVTRGRAAASGRPNPSGTSAHASSLATTRSA